MSIKPYGVYRLRRAIIHFITGRFVQALARGILLLVLIRLLELSDYGAYMLLVGLSEMMLRLVSFGILPVGQRFIPELIMQLPAERFSRFIICMFALQSLILSVAVIVIWKSWTIITPYFGFDAQQIAATMPGVLLLLLVPAFRFAGEIMEALMEQGSAQLTRALMPVGRLAGIGLLLAFGHKIDLQSILALDIAITTVCLLYAYRLLQKSLVLLQSHVADGEIPVRKMLRYAWHMAAVDLLGSAGSPGAVRMVLANTLGVVESGLFAFLQSLQRLVGRYLPGTLLRNIIRPMLVSRASMPGGLALVKSSVNLLLKSNLIVVAAGSVVVAMCGDDIVNWASGGKFSNAGLTLLLMFMVLAFSSQRSVLEIVMQITMHTATLRATELLTPATLAIVWVFAGYGLNTAILILAMAAATAYAILAIVLARSEEDIRLDTSGLMAILVPAACVIAAGFMMRVVIDPFIVAVMALTLFGVLMLVARPYDLNEVNIIERTAGRKIAGLFRGMSCDRSH